MSLYARISFLRPHDGDTVDFEAGYTHHLGLLMVLARPLA